MKKYYDIELFGAGGEPQRDKTIEEVLDAKYQPGMHWKVVNRGGVQIISKWGLEVQEQSIVNEKNN